MSTERRDPLRSKWFLPLFAVFLGAVGGLTYIAAIVVFRLRS